MGIDGEEEGETEEGKGEAVVGTAGKRREQEGETADEEEGGEEVQAGVEVLPPVAGAAARAVDAPLPSRRELHHGRERRRYNTSQVKGMNNSSSICGCNSFVLAGAVGQRLEARENRARVGRI